MRRKNREVTDPEMILGIISRCDIIRLGLNDTDVPYVVPLNFAYRVNGDSKVEFFFHSAVDGHKLDLIQKDPRCFFEMDCDHEIVSDKDTSYCTEQYSCVMGKGTITMVEDDASRYNALAALNQRYHPGEHFPVNLASMPRTAVFKITVQKMTAKSNVGKIPIKKD